MENGLDTEDLSMDGCVLPPNMLKGEKIGNLISMICFCKFFK